MTSRKSWINSLRFRIQAQKRTIFLDLSGNIVTGTSPDHSSPFMYYFVGKQEKSQALLNEIMDRFYDMGKDKLAYAGMDDAGEMSSWYVFNAIGIYPFSPANDDYIRLCAPFQQSRTQVGR